MNISTYETLNVRIVRMLIHSRDHQFNELFIKNYLQKKTKAYVFTVLETFKKFHNDFAKEKADDLVCELGYDQYLKSIKNVKPLGLLIFCKDCGAALIDRIQIIVKPHICWNKVNLGKFQFRYECIAILLENKTITIEDAKFLVWSIEENGTCKLNCHKFI